MSGSKPRGEKAMSSAERVKAHRERKRREREAATSERRPELPKIPDVVTRLSAIEDGAIPPLEGPVDLARSRRLKRPPDPVIAVQVDGDRCPSCGALFALVGRVHRCVPF